MRDGVVLRADHYEPALTGAPTVLVRTPYGRRGVTAVLARTLAEQGFNVLVQCCRGTFDSGGTFAPMRHEHDDGVDTVDWLRRQSWYSGELCTFGPSYVGFTQWAIAADVKPDLKAMATIVTASGFRDSTYAGGAFSLDTVLTWAELMQAQDTPLLTRQWELLRGQPRLRRALSHLPLSEADLVATGAEVAFVREWLRHSDPDDPYWSDLGHAHRIGEVDAAVLMIGGWHDIFLPWQLRDYAALLRAGRSPRLVIGPWTHGSPGLYLFAVRQAVAWFQANTGAGATSAGAESGVDGAAAVVDGAAATDRGTGITVYVDGAGDWRDLAEWPPKDFEPTPWYLGANGALSPRGVPAGPPDRLWYDPADPTPNLGGPLLIGKTAGRRDNRRLEARPDVLVYTSDVLDDPVEVTGPVRAVVYVRPDLAHFDVFVRLCDVDPAGRSWNVCDGLVRVADAAPGKVREVEVELWPAGYRFQTGHRVRVQVSGGAHPRWSRNPGTGEPLGTAVELRAGGREILHDERYPSAIVLPQARAV
ncbi:MAG TPA: CocE/NonD family hydrolase [Micromonosporaceae bacterium]